MRQNNYLTPNWPAPKNVKAFSSTRLDGHSTGVFASLNLGFRGGDNPELVNANRAQLITDLALPGEPKWLRQIHGNLVVQADAIPGTVDADAAFTRATNTVCIAMTADCLPLLVCDQQGSCVAAIHAGWRGLLAGVIDTTLDAMRLSPETTLVWLGPAIGPTKFEVGVEVREQFIHKDPHAKQVFTEISSDKYLMNMYAYAKQRLQQRGITQIFGGDRCTYSEPDYFYSYRRDKGLTGSLASLIWLTT